jgi:cytochrome d ubiquinol oxidase subunit II
VAAAGAPTGLLAGWALGVYPWALPGQVPLTEAAASEVIAGPVLVVLVAGLALVAPCYAYLIRVLRARPD